MTFSEEDVRLNRNHFAEKLRAERQLADVMHWAKREPGAPGIVLLGVLLFSRVTDRWSRRRQGVALPCS